MSEAAPFPPLGFAVGEGEGDGDGDGDGEGMGVVWYRMIT